MSPHGTPGVLTDTQPTESLGDVVPLPLEVTHLAGAVDLFVEFIVPQHFAFHDRIVYHIVNSPPGKREHTLQRALEDAVLRRVGRLDRSQSLPERKQTG